MNNTPIRVVWLCNFSNAEVRSHLSFASGTVDAFLRKLTKSNEAIHLVDYGQWITNGINEFKLFPNVELHVVSPHYRLNKRIQEFKIDSVFYHFYSDESFSFLWKILSIIGFHKHPLYRKNCKTISKITQKISPDIFQLIGAENVNYSIFVLKYSFKIPLIVQLQTLVNNPKVYASLSNNREYIKNIESAILRKADYIFASSPTSISIIKESIAPNAIILAIKLAVGVVIDKSETKKVYDFVYFSVNINKAADLALEAFSIAKQRFPNITLDLIGYYSSEYKQRLDEFIESNNLSDSVFFEGHLLTHEDVMRQVRKARFALLPLRPDLLPSTIREAMALGCPVISTITPITPSLNERRLSALLSEPEDSKGLASNMCRLLNDPDLCFQMRENAYLTVQEKYDNKTFMLKMLEAYQACLNHYKNQIPIPSSLQ